MDKVTADLGCFVVSGTGVNLVNFFGFIANADSVVNSMTVTKTSDGSQDTGAVATMGMTGITIKQGNFISVAKGYKITSIKLTSGSIIGYNR